VKPSASGEIGKAVEVIYKGAEQAKASDVVAQDLRLFARLMKNMPGLNADISTSVIPLETRLESLDAVTKELQLNPYSVEVLIGLLDEPSLYDNLDKIVEALEEHSRFVRKELHGTVTSAVQLSAAQKSKLEARLAKVATPGATISLDYDVDKAVVGGLSIKIGKRDSCYYV
jgi:F0F1-type ATP synthase delta subunit